MQSVEFSLSGTLQGRKLGLVSVEYRTGVEYEWVSVLYIRHTVAGGRRRPHDSGYDELWMTIVH
jgi:hypothetical protein